MLNRLLSWFAARQNKPMERRHVVDFDETRVTVTDSHGETDSVSWDDLELIAIETSDLGPFAPDVFWVLLGGNSRCVVPQEADGADALLERLQTLPGFSNEAFIEAMGSTEQKRFVCWQKSQP